MIGITTIAQNTAGDMVFQEDPSSALLDADVRASRTATLDGGVVIDNQGFSDGDRTLEITAELDESAAAKLWALHRSEASVHVAISEGVFLATIKRLRIDNGECRLTIYIEEKLS